MFTFTEAKLKEVLKDAARGKPDASNLHSVVTALVKFGPQTGLDKPHRFVQYGGQLMLESGEFRWDKEIWGPTVAQKGYEGRKGLGNTRPGDGKKFAGRGPIQITGRANYHQFTRWARVLDPKCPDFEANPELVNTDPWEGLGPIWFWRTRSLNTLADQGDTRAITKKINGGYNHADERLAYVIRLSLVTLGYRAHDVRAFQFDNLAKHKLTIDGVAGPATRAAMHKELVAL
jgi:putative chitinase